MRQIGASKPNIVQNVPGCCVASAPGLVASDLVPATDAAVLYARPDVGIDAVRVAFPTQSIWRYLRQDPTQAGELVEVTP